MKECVAKPSKMYLLLLDIMDTGHAVNTAAHAGAMIQSHWPWVHDGFEDAVMADWYNNSFRKVSCRCTREELDKARKVAEETEPPMQYFEVTESAYDGQVVALVFKPRVEWPGFFRSLKLYK